MALYDPKPTITDWREDPRAKVILASIAKHPPQYEWRTATYVQTRDEWNVYVGYRVECLERIYGEYFARCNAYYAATGDWSAHDDFSAYPTVQMAVSEAVTPPRVMEPEPSCFDMLMAATISGMRPYREGGVA